MSLLNELVKKITKVFPFMEFPLSMSRQGDFPLDKSSLWWDQEAATNYAKNDPTAYPGQPITVVDEASNTVTLYVVGTKGELVAQGGMASVDALKQELTKHKADYDTLKTAYEKTKADVTKLRTDHDTLKNEHDALYVSHGQLDAKVTELDKHEKQLKKDHDALAAKHEQLQTAHTALDGKVTTLSGKHDDLNTKVTELDAHEKQLKTDFDALKKTYDAHTHSADKITESTTRVFMTPAQKTKLDEITYATNADIDGLFPELAEKP